MSVRPPSASGSERLRVASGSARPRRAERSTEHDGAAEGDAPMAYVQTQSASAPAPLGWPRKLPRSGGLLLCGPRAAGRDAFCRAVTSLRELGCHHQGSRRRAAGRRAPLCVSTADGPPAPETEGGRCSQPEVAPGDVPSHGVLLSVFSFSLAAAARAKRLPCTLLAAQQRCIAAVQGCPTPSLQMGLGVMGAHSLPCCEAM